MCSYIIGLLYPETTVHTAYLEYRNWQHKSVNYILGMLDDILSSIGQGVQVIVIYHPALPLAEFVILSFLLTIAPQRPR